MDTTSAWTVREIPHLAKIAENENITKCVAV
jgi:hypothetical protein